MSRSDKKDLFQKTSIKIVRRNYNKIIKDISEKGIVCPGGQEYQFNELCYNHPDMEMDVDDSQKCTLGSESFFILNPL